MQGNAEFPLTPTLSHREREPLGGTLQSPLPEGEGQGEGAYGPITLRTICSNNRTTDELPGLIAVVPLTVTILDPQLSRRNETKFCSFSDRCSYVIGIIHGGAVNKMDMWSNNVKSFYNLLIFLVTRLCLVTHASGLCPGSGRFANGRYTAYVAGFLSRGRASTRAFPGGASLALT